MKQFGDGFEPRWDITGQYGEQAELWVRDIVSALQRDDIEVKRDGHFRRTGNLYIEFEHDPGRRGRWKPCGIRRTSAELWVHVLDLGVTEVALVLPVDLLRRLCQPFIDRGEVREQTEGSCPTRGVALPLRYVTDALSGRLHGGAIDLSAIGRIRKAANGGAS